MSSNSFDRALKFVLRWEGGYSHDEADPGGETYCGISRVNHPDWPGWAKVDSGYAVEKMGLEDDVRDFYRTEFWTPLRSDDMPDNVAVVCFDTAVNCGKGRAARWLQEAVGVVQDGSVGPKTTAAVNAAPGEAIRGLFASRADHYVLIVAKNPALRKFLRGWDNRLNALRQEVA